MCILTDTVAKSRKFPLWADAAVYLSIPGHICVAYWVAPNQDKGGWEEWLKYLWERGDRSSRSLTISWILALKCHPGQWRCKREASQNCHVIQSNQLNTLLLISQIVLLLCWFEFVHQVLQYNHALHFAAWSLSLPSCDKTIYLGHWQRRLIPVWPARPLIYHSTVVGKTFSKGITHSCLWGHLFTNCSWSSNPSTESREV